MTQLLISSKTVLYLKSNIYFRDTVGYTLDISFNGNLWTKLCKHAGMMKMMLDTNIYGYIAIFKLLLRLFGSMFFNET